MQREPLPNHSLDQHSDMALKYVILAALVAAANAGYLGGYAAAPVAYAAPAAVAPAAVTSQHSNILRSYGNLGQVSTYSKTIDTPYSSVRKSDVRVSNDALAYHGAYAAPAVAAYHGAYAAPAVAAYQGAYAAPAVAAYHGAYAAPALAAYNGYAAPYAARYAAPAAYAAPVAAAHGLLGVAYSAAPAVAHISYSNAYGINYAY